MGATKTARHAPSVATMAETESNIRFGCSLAACLALLSAAISAWAGEPNPIPLMLGTCALLLVLWSPNSFGPAKRFWHKSLIATGQAVIVIVWVVYILPAGLIMQARGRDPLNLRFEPKARSYWKPPLPTSNMEKSS